MRKIASFLLLLASQTLFAQNQADAYYGPQAMAQAREKLMHDNGDQLNYLILGERFENQVHDGDSSLVWEAQGWLGKDLHRFWLKTEGHYDVEADSTGEFELQALYSRAISPFWDLQLGMRHDFEPGEATDYAVIGLQGLAPYWFEVDAAAFVSERGDASARLEAEYELRFTQRLILQPRVELNYAFSDAPEIAIGQGMSKAHLGLRLRYEIRREFAPYAGISWESSYGGTADLLRQAGQRRDQFSAVFGIRFWY